MGCHTAPVGLHPGVYPAVLHTVGLPVERRIEIGPADSRTEGRHAGRCIEIGLVDPHTEQLLAVSRTVTDPAPHTGKSLEGRRMRRDPAAHRTGVQPVGLGHRLERYTVTYSLRAGTEGSDGALASALRLSDGENLA